MSYIPKDAGIEAVATLFLTRPRAGPFINTVINAIDPSSP